MHRGAEWVMVCVEDISDSPFSGTGCANCMAICAHTDDGKEILCSYLFLNCLKNVFC